MATLRPLFRSFLRHARTLAESGMVTGSPYDTEEKGSARRTPAHSAHSQPDDEAANFFGYSPAETKKKASESKAKTAKQPWKPGGRWQPMPQAPDAKVQHPDGIEMNEGRVSEAYDDVAVEEVPVLKHPGTEPYGARHAQPVTPNTAGSESPIIGYAR
jgi:hypothetical protein